MKVKIEQVAAPRASKADGRAIDCVVQVAHLPGVDLPFTASADDPEQHGRELFAKLTAGDFGNVAAFVPPVQK